MIYPLSEDALGQGLAAGEAVRGGAQVSGLTVVASPFTSARRIELGKSTRRKRLLPVGEIDYKGGVLLRFTHDYLQGLAAAFSDGASSQTRRNTSDSGEAGRWR